MRSRVGHRSVRLTLLVLAVASAVAAQTGKVGPVGAEFLVNLYTPTREWRSATAGNDDGFVVVWHSAPHHDEDFDGVFAQRFASDGTRLGTEFQVNNYTTGSQYYADVAMAADGDFIVVWQSFGQDAFSNGVFAQRFASAGTPVGVEFQVNTTTSRDEREASVAMDTGGNFVVAWTSFLGDGSSDAVLAQRFDSMASRVGGEFLVNSHTQLTQKSPRVAMADGRFVVVWQSFGQDDPSDYGVFGRRFGSNGAALGVEFQVNQVTFLTQWRPDVATGAGGDFVVVWDAFEDGDFRGIIARRFDSSGAGQGVQFVVNTHTPDDQRNAAIAKGPTGAFVVAWSSYIDGASYDDMRARFFDSTGVAEGLEFQVNAVTAPKQFRPSVAAMGDTRFVVAWEGSDGGAGDYDVYARRVERVPLATLDVDGNGSNGALTDGLLVLRFLFGFSGTTLTSSAVGEGCTRCTGAEITPYLSGLGLTLDADGNSSLTALTDGLLVLRFLFGFTGATLVNGATGPGCTRCTGTEVASYLATLV